MSRNNLPPNRSSNTNRSKSNSRDLVTNAYNNQIIVKNQDGEYAPVGKYKLIKFILMQTNLRTKI